jgi:hypothetical protein
LSGYVKSIKLLFAINQLFSKESKNFIFSSIGMAGAEQAKTDY